MFDGRSRQGVWLALTLVLVLLVFTGCGKKNNQSTTTKSSGAVYAENGLPKDEKVELTVLRPHQGDGKDGFMYAVRTFEEKFPNVKINVRWIEGRPAHRNLIQSLLQSGNDEDMYDYFYSFESWTEQLIEEGKVEPQDELWARTLYDSPNTKVKDVLLADKRLIFKNGHVYAIPEGISVLGLFYNKKMFEKYGWNEKPQDWEEFLALCSQIKKSGINPMVIAGQKPGYFTYTWGAIPFEVGGEKYANALYNWESNIYISNPYVTMLERLAFFVDKDYFHPGTISFDHTQSQMEFLQGKAAMVSSGGWVEKEMAGVMPEGFEWGFMPFPGNNKGQNQVILTSENQHGYIWKNRPEIKKKWAKEFKLWCLNLDLQKKSMESGVVPIRKDFNISGDEKNATVAVVLQNEIMNQKVVVQTNRPDFRVRQITNVEMSKLNIAINDGFVEIITRKLSPKQVAEKINRQYMKGIAADK